MEPNEAKAQHEARLLALKGVVAVGCGTKKMRGVNTGQPCVCVLVKKKVPLASLAVGEVVPAALEGVATDVVEVGDIEALGLSAPPSPVALATGMPHQERHRPVVGGVSIGPTNFGLSGTIGLPLVYKGDVPCLLSNTHVIAPYWYNQGMAPAWFEKYGIKLGAPIRQPSLPDGGTEQDYVAELLEWAEIKTDAPNDMDAAIAQLTVEARPELLGLGGYREEAEPGLGMAVKKSGRTSGITEGKVVYTDLTVKVGYPFGEALFQGQVSVEPAMLSPGDSGSAIVIGGALDVVVALGFAGSSVLSIVTPIKRILGAFGLTFTPPGTPVAEALASILPKVKIMWGFDNRSKAWSMWEPASPQVSDLKMLRPGMGYWLELTGDAVLAYGGRSQLLYAGWNLIGWPS